VTFAPQNNDIILSWTIYAEWKGCQVTSHAYDTCLWVAAPWWSSPNM